MLDSERPATEEIPARVECEVKIKCSHCEGKGSVEFTGVFADTLNVLRKERQPIIGATLARRQGVAVTAMANRLVWLERHGLAKSERYGRKKLWRAA